MRPRLILLALGLACPLQAQPDRYRCPDERVKPVFTGHPFRPVECPDPKTPQGRASSQAVSGTAPRPAAKDPRFTSLAPLVGAWKGLTYYAGNRYEIELDLQRVKGRVYEARLKTMDYHTHIGYELKAVLKQPFFKPQPLLAEVSLEHLPGAELDATVWLGAAPPEDGKPPVLDRELQLAYGHRGGRHRLQFAWDGKDAADCLYTYHDPAHGPLRASGRLNRISR